MKGLKVHWLLFILLLPVFLLVACGNKDKKIAESNSPYKNGIQLETKKFVVKQAYLVFDDSTKLGEDNSAGVGQHVNLQLVIDSGWTAENGLIYPGISQKIESDDGKHVFEKSDLMENHGGVDAKDGWLVTIQANINTVDKQYDYFLVSFRVWDKKGDGEIKGTYKLHPK